MHRRYIAALAAAFMAFHGSLTFSQSYPNKPVRIITAEIGSPNDFLARALVPGLSNRLGQQVIVDNRSIIAIEVVARASPDGYTLLSYGSPFWLASLLRDNVPWDPIKDFAPITMGLSSPGILVVHPSLPVKSLKELIALAKSRPGELNYGSASTASTTHLAGEAFKAMAGVNIVRINFKSSGSGVIALIGGQIQIMFPNLGAVGQHVKSGKLRALAVTSAQPSELAPELPTMTAAGLPGFESVTLSAIYAPAATPAAIITRLNQDMVQVLNSAEVKKLFFNAGVETVGSSPERLTAMMQSEIARLGKVIKAAGIRAE